MVYTHVATSANDIIYNYTSYRLLVCNACCELLVLNLRLYHTFVTKVVRWEQSLH